MLNSLPPALGLTEKVELEVGLGEGLVHLCGHLHV